MNSAVLPSFDWSKHQIIYEAGKHLREKVSGNESEIEQKMLRALPNSSLHVDSPLGLGQPICCQPAFEDSASPSLNLCSSSVKKEIVQRPGRRSKFLVLRLLSLLDIKDMALKKALWFTLKECWFLNGLETSRFQDFPDFKSIPYRKLENKCPPVAKELVFYPKIW